MKLWSPTYRKDVIKLENVQKNIVLRLLRLELFSLERRRVRDDFIEYMFMMGIDKLNAHNLFPVV